MAMKQTKDGFRSKSKEEENKTDIEEIRKTDPTATNTSIIGSSLQGKPIQATAAVSQLRLSVNELLPIGVLEEFYSPITNQKK